MREHVCRTLRDLFTDIRAVSVVEFALMLPILLLVGAGGIEMINYLLANQKIERIASITADNIARNTLAPSERSFVDTFYGVDDIAAPFDLRDEGRVILTGVIGVPEGGKVVSKVVWQRCDGRLAGVASVIGKEASDPNKWAEGKAVTLPNEIKLLQNQMAVVSEVAYRYKPLISLSMLRSGGDEKIVRQRSIYVSRGQAFPYVTPNQGVTAAKCG
jgi:hypothetical protein